MKRIQALFCAVLLLFVSIVGLVTLTNHTPHSEAEGRSYAQFPPLFEIREAPREKMNQLADAFEDQLAGREAFVKSYYTLLYKGLGLRYMHEIFIGEDNYLFRVKPAVRSAAARERELSEIAALVNAEARKCAENGSVFIYVHIPLKNAVMPEQLPAYYPASSEVQEVEFLKAHLSKDVHFVDGQQLFTESGKGCAYYYKTDHHLNFAGHLKLYSEIIPIIQKEFPNVPVLTADDFELQKQRVVGSYNRDIGSVVDAGEEPLNITLKHQSFTYDRWDNGELSQMPVFGKGNTYASAFMGTDFGRTEIVTNHADYPNILIAGSSFTNAMEGLILSDCSKMVSVDYRHNTTDGSISAVAAETDADFVIFMPAERDDYHIDFTSVKKHIGVKS